MRGPSANENPERIVVVFHEENSRAAPYITFCFVFFFFRPWQRTMRWTNKSRFLKRTKASAALLASSLQSEMCVNRIRYTVAFTQPSYKIWLVFFLFFICYFPLFFGGGSLYLYEPTLSKWDLDDHHGGVASRHVSNSIQSKRNKTRKREMREPFHHVLPRVKQERRLVYFFMFVAILLACKWRKKKKEK